MTRVVLKCVDCGREYPSDPWLFQCPKCGGLLEVVLEDIVWDPRGKGVWRYTSLLPDIGGKPVSLGEGGTPLVSSVVHDNMYIKFEGANPTGSFKDRGMTLAVSLARNIGAKAVIAASTGNTAASLSAYSSRAGLKSIIVLPKGKVAQGKLAQSILYGAIIISIKGSFDDALETVMKSVDKSGGLLYPLNSFNPWRLEGQKTIIYEIIEELGEVDNIIYPIGNGGNISAGWKAIRELFSLGVIKRKPRLIGVQALGAAPIYDAWRKGLEKPVFYDNPETIATAIRIGKPVNWPKVMKALRDTNGVAVGVSDEEIISAQKNLASNEGLAVEPASAASYAGYLKLLEKGFLDKKETTVLVATGHGLKDPESMEKHGTRIISVEPEEAVSKIINVFNE